MRFLSDNQIRNQIGPTVLVLTAYSVPFIRYLISHTGWILSCFYAEQHCRRSLLRQACINRDI